ncbi:DNA-deoxyinosine glycosylase [Herbaspirillum sp. NPDC087042]|uniref:DNA-deoxyinosine glycosylase n=1 Tax=Herbaspirillum sp. NPDC087042 TaxID=3364004 RepID=UPI003818FC26
MNRKRSFPPVVNADIEILILGSLPGEISLKHQQYYAHPQNRFWALVSGVIEEDITSLSYLDRLDALLRNKIGLWDVVAEAKRIGSLDGNIREHVHNDLLALLVELPVLKTIAFNGGTAERLGMKVLRERASDYRILRLPSSSAAYTRPYTEKLSQWMNLRSKI